jgi:hypothetical protein
VRKRVTNGGVTVQAIAGTSWYTIWMSAPASLARRKADRTPGSVQLARTLYSSKVEGNV